MKIELSSAAANRPALLSLDVSLDSNQLIGMKYVDCVFNSGAVQFAATLVIDDKQLLDLALAILKRQFTEWSR